MKRAPEVSNTPSPARRRFPSHLQSVGKIIHHAGQAGERQDRDQSERKLEEARKYRRIKSGNCSDYLSMDKHPKLAHIRQHFPKAIVK